MAKPGRRATPGHAPIGASEAAARYRPRKGNPALDAMRLKGWRTITEAAVLVGMTTQAIDYLAREGRIEQTRVGVRRLVSEASLRSRFPDAFRRAKAPTGKAPKPTV